MSPCCFLSRLTSKRNRLVQTENISRVFRGWTKSEIERLPVREREYWNARARMVAEEEDSVSMALMKLMRR